MSEFVPSGNLGKSFSTREALPSKAELVRVWFKDHPDDVSRTGRDLSENVKPHGVKISHKSWNDGKPKQKTSADGVGG